MFAALDLTQMRTLNACKMSELFLSYAQIDPGFPHSRTKRQSRLGIISRGSYGAPPLY